MKRMITALLCLAMLASFAACDLDSVTNPTDDDRIPYGSMSMSDIYPALEAEKVFATNMQVHLDMEDEVPCLSADLKNNHTETISNITLAFAAWDSAGLPVLLKSASGKTEDSYVKQVGMGDVTVAPGETWFAEDEDSVMGFRVAAEQNNIAYVKVCVISCTLGEDTAWSNPYYDEWHRLHYNKLLPLRVADPTETTE